MRQAGAKAAALGAALGAWAVAAGCGSSGASDPVTVTAPAPAATSTAAAAAATKAQFIAAADELCLKAREALQPLGDELDAAAQSSDFSQLASVLRRSATVLEGLGARMGSLAVPADDAGIRRELAASLQRFADLSRRTADAAAEQDSDRVDVYLTDLNSETDRFQGVAQGYGFHRCGNTG